MARPACPVALCRQGGAALPTALQPSPAPGPATHNQRRTLPRREPCTSALFRHAQRDEFRALLSLVDGGRQHGAAIFAGLKRGELLRKIGGAGCREDDRYQDIHVDLLLCVT